MPEYLSPGVYIEEVDAGPRPIAKLRRVGAIIAMVGLGVLVGLVLTRGFSRKQAG
jgi:phage tail sheath protein FI